VTEVEHPIVSDFSEILSFRLLFFPNIPRLPKALAYGLLPTIRAQES
jgi:hypothetical protein